MKQKPTRTSTKNYKTTNNKIMEDFNIDELKNATVNFSETETKRPKGRPRKRIEISIIEHSDDVFRQFLGGGQAKIEERDDDIATRIHVDFDKQGGMMVNIRFISVGEAIWYLKQVEKNLKKHGKDFRF